MTDSKHAGLPVAGCTPERDRLIDRVRGYFAQGCRNIQVSWGPDAHLCTEEQRAASLNKAFEAIENGDYDEIDFSLPYPHIAPKNPERVTLASPAVPEK